MERCEQLNGFISGMSQMTHAMLAAGIITVPEHQKIYTALWGVLIAAEKQRDDERKARQLAEETAACL